MALSAVIASEAKQSIAPSKGQPGLLRRFAPRNVAVAGNDEQESLWQ